MSEFDLSVGASYEDRRRALCASHLRDLGLSGEVSSLGLQAQEPVKLITLLNIATVGCFLDYVAESAGRPTGELMDDPAFANLPYWQDSLWAPLDFTPAKAFEDDSDGPFFFGSSPRLLAALNHIKTISRIPLGPAPSQYEVMISDPRTFYKTFDRLADEQSCIQWVWRGLHDAATLALQKRVPMLGNGL